MSFPLSQCLAGLDEISTYSFCLPVVFGRICIYLSRPGPQFIESGQQGSARYRMLFFKSLSKTAVASHTTHYRLRTGPNRAY
jgi:hypothetical protein